MPEPVFAMMTVLCQVVLTLPVGTNLGMLYLLWVRR